MWHIRNWHRWSPRSRRPSNCLLQWEAEWYQIMILHLWQGVLCGNSSTSPLTTLFTATRIHSLIRPWGPEIYIYSQKKLNARHGWWIEFLQDYTFTICHVMGVGNKAANTLRRKVFVLTKMSMVVNYFEKLRTEYESSPNFCDIYAILKDRATREVNGYTLHMGICSEAENYAFQGPHLENFLSGSCTPVV